MSAEQDLRRFINKLQKIVGESQSNTQLKALGEFAVDLIVKRTRQGYGVSSYAKEKRLLKPLSEKYVKFRKKNKSKLSPLTTPTKSNLTFTGKMLDSMGVRKVGNGTVIVGPKGSRNLKVAGYVAEKGRPFNNLAKDEIEKLVRYYRRLFGDIVDRKK